ncbi:MAG: carboxypeptidase regulatory-like domain-containing protein [Acidobacteria bacterium]|nr:carboxypeptidase regulatory-like domain-containing protein [Acidobacteriota bacterium]
MNIRKVLVVLSVLLFSAAAFAQAKTNRVPPQYNIFDIGIVQGSDTASQGFRISPGNVAVGRSLRSGGSQAFSWTLNGGISGLSNFGAMPYCVSNAANDAGTVVGTCATTVFGSGRLPVIWVNGVASQLPLPSGETIGDANAVNSSGVAVGSADGGSTQGAVIYSGGTGTWLSQTTNTGCFFRTAFDINNSGRVVGFGVDPNNAARNVGMVYDIGSQSAFEVGSLSGGNGALAFGISNAGHVVGSSMMNQGAGTPFIWTEAGGMTAIPLATGTSQGSARGVNSAGWAVGTDSSAFAIPFLYDGTQTYRLADIIPSGTGWDLSTNTSSAALGISEDNVIVGTGVFNGAPHAFAMVPVKPITVSGRVTTSSGTGIRNVIVVISGGDLAAPVQAMSTGFGYFKFDLWQGVKSATTYNVTVNSKRFTFTPSTQTLTAVNDVSDVNFVAD